MLFFTIRLNNTAFFSIDMTAFTAYSYVWFSTFLGLVLELLFLGLIISRLRWSSRLSQA